MQSIKLGGLRQEDKANQTLVRRVTSATFDVPLVIRALTVYRPAARWAENAASGSRPRPSGHDKGSANLAVGLTMTLPNKREPGEQVRAPPQGH